MSDLIHLFGNDNAVTTASSKSNTPSTRACDIVYNDKRATRPNTLKTRKDACNNKLSQKHIKTPNNGYKFQQLSKFPLTPASVSVKLFEDFVNSPVSLHSSLSCSDLSNLPNALPPENADGNIEYKVNTGYEYAPMTDERSLQRQLLNLTPLRLQHLITQLKWRLAEGEGQAIYEIGVDDDGKVSGLEKMELAESMTNLCKMADSLNASVSILRECTVGSRQALEILIRKLPTHFSVSL